LGTQGEPLHLLAIPGQYISWYWLCKISRYNTRCS